MNTWKRYQKKQLWRVSGYGIPKRMKIDRGCNFFILALEALGAKTISSCEGHPEDFYIIVRCKYALAARIASVGYLTVQIMRRGVFRIQINESGYQPFNEIHRQRILRGAAEAWNQDLFGGKFEAELK